MTTERKKQLKSEGWGGGFDAAPKMKTRVLQKSPESSHLDLAKIAPVDTSNESSVSYGYIKSRAVIVVDKEEPVKSNWHDCLPCFKT